MKIQVALAAFSAISVTSSAVSIRGDRELYTNCVHDDCPAISVVGAGTSTIDGVYKPFRSCDDYPYGKNTYDAYWQGYTNNYGASLGFYWKDRSFRGWGVATNKGDIAYYDGLNRNTPTELQLDKWVMRSSYGKAPIPRVTCLSGATTFWQYLSTNPSSTWTTSTGTQYSEVDKESSQVQASIGVKYGAVETSTSYQRTTEKTISQTMNTDKSETCTNPCGTDRALWVFTIDTGATQTLQPQCGMITCVPLGAQPLCPVEYCGGDTVFDGCQCCSSNEWIDDSFTGPRPPICEKTPPPTPAPTRKGKGHN